jgi:acyl-CoA synthetase (AMP-forming)/AMP-acid ligase II
MAETVFAATQSALGRRPRTVRLRKGELDRGFVAPAAPSEEDGVEFVSCGAPLPGVEIAVWDERRLPAAADRVGQLAIRAPFLFEGYHRQPERTAASFHEGYFMTGDLGFSIDGEIFVLGRLDDVVVLSGRSVFASEIEDIVSRIGGVRPGRVFAFGLYDETVGTRELVVVAERDDPDADATELRKAIRARVHGALGVAPRKVRLVEAGWIVKSTSGKLNRRENSRKYEAVFVDGGPGAF